MSRNRPRAQGQVEGNRGLQSQGHIQRLTGKRKQETLEVLVKEEGEKMSMER